MTRTLFFLLFFCNEFPCCFAQPDWIAREAAFKEYCIGKQHLSPIEGIWVLHAEMKVYDSRYNHIYNLKFLESSKMIILKEGRGFCAYDIFHHFKDGFDFLLRKSLISGDTKSERKLFRPAYCSSFFSFTTV